MFPTCACPTIDTFQIVRENDVEFLHDLIHYGHAEMNEDVSLNECFQKESSWMVSIMQIFPSFTNCNFKIDYIIFYILTTFCWNA